MNVQKTENFIKTDRLLLRPLTVADADAAFLWLGDERVSQYMCYTTYHSVQQVREWLVSVENDENSNLFGFERLADGQLIGSGDIGPDRKNGFWGFGYNLRFDCWGNGYATEAVKAMIQFSHVHFGAKKFASSHAEPNLASGNVMKKCGPWSMKWSFENYKIMNIFTLCNAINLQDDLKRRVFDFAQNFDFRPVETYLRDFRVYQNMGNALEKLQSALGHDEENVKILACMLKASADIYDFYQENAISDDIYFATMKCYTRFVEETFKMTGKFYFDRFWWTPRQAGGHLFRIGALEFELKRLDNNDKIVGIHIPSDADFSPDNVDQSLADAKCFFASRFPEFVNVEYQCHSWLLDGSLKNMLDENSNIVSFQKRFDIFDRGEVSTDFLEWVFHTKSVDYDALAENTSLQRNLKKHLISGGIVRNAAGKLI